MRSLTRSLPSLPVRSAGQPLTTQQSHCVALPRGSGMASCQQTAYHAACPHAQHTADSANVCRGLVGAIAKVFGMNGSRSALRSCKCCLLPPLSACSCHHLKYAMFSAYLAAHHLNKSSTLQLCRTAHHPRHLRTPQRWNSLLSSLLVVGVKRSFHPPHCTYFCCTPSCLL